MPYSTADSIFGIRVGAAGDDAGGDLGPPAAQVAGGDQAVGAVVPWANQDEDADPGSRPAQPFAGLFGDGQAGLFHQCVQADAPGRGGLLDGRHFGGGYDFHGGP